MKYLIIIPDGAADQPQASLAGKTPLAAARTPALDALAAIPGVARVEADGECSFRISFADQCDPTDALVRRAVEESWGLFQLVPAQTSVEEVFVQLTQKDEAAA